MAAVTDSVTHVTQQVGHYTVSAAVTFGPRVVSLIPDGGPDLLAHLDPGLTLDTGNGEVFRFHGGHRLWASPEVPAVTYAPDDAPCEVSYAEGRLRMKGTVDPAGILKEMSVSAAEDRLIVDHRLTWLGDHPTTAGAWAITQVPLGATALLPLVGNRNGDELQADRSLVLWPYTQLADSRLTLHRQAVLIETNPGPPLKLGSGPAPGSIGYLRQGWLFTKRIEAVDHGDYPDRGAIAQVFTNQHFCELESLGPLRELRAGDSVDYREIWSATRCPDPETALASLLGDGA